MVRYAQGNSQNPGVPPLTGEPSSIRYLEVRTGFTKQQLENGVPWFEDTFEGVNLASPVTAASRYHHETRTSWQDYSGTSDDRTRFDGITWKSSGSASGATYEVTDSHSSTVGNSSSSTSGRIAESIVPNKIFTPLLGASQGGRWQGISTSESTSTHAAPVRKAAKKHSDGFWISNPPPFSAASARGTDAMFFPTGDASITWDTLTATKAIASEPPDDDEVNTSSSESSIYLGSPYSLSDFLKDFVGAMPEIPDDDFKMGTETSNPDILLRGRALELVGVHTQRYYGTATPESDGQRYILAHSLVKAADQSASARDAEYWFATDDPDETPSKSWIIVFEPTDAGGNVIGPVTIEGAYTWDPKVESVSTKRHLYASPLLAGANPKSGRYVLWAFEISFEPVADNNNIGDNKKKVFVGDGNPKPDEWMPGKGKRVFPDAKNKDDQTPRNKVKVKVKTAPGAVQYLYLKAFDVDDPTENDPQHVIDNNDTDQVKVGDDNKDLNGGGSRIPGKFVATQSDTIALKVGTDGVATLESGGDVEFLVTMQPGDNYRIAVALKQEDLNVLQVQNSSAASYVKPSDEQSTGFNGLVSPMLTVWRKLYLEVDSMTAVPDTGDQKNYEAGTIETVTTQSGTTGPQSTIRLSIRLTGPADRYEWGHIDIADVGTFEVLTNTDNLISNDDIVVKGAPGSAAGKTFKIYDDDDKYLPLLGLPAPLPRNDQHAAVINGIQEKFSAAYIQIEDANALGGNPRQTIDFKLNAPVAGFLGASVFDDAKDLHDGPTKRDFWAHTLVFGYQPQAASDHDPSTNEDLLSGGTPKDNVELWSYGYSVVFMESIRESEIGPSIAPAVLTNPEIAKDYRDHYGARLLGVCAHEIGHSPGGHNEAADHAEGGIMQATGSTINDVFTPASILRFRRAWTWSYQVGGR